MAYREHWERNALNWASFTRGPEPDAYHDFAPQFFTLLPPPGRATLEVGCGEGRVCRDLRDRGYAPIGIDGAPTLVRLAQEADPGGDYRVADAADLPFPDEAFDLVVAYNVLMDVDDLRATVAEIARVPEPGGVLVAGVTHPIADAGRFVERRADAAFVIEGTYLEPRPFRATFRRNDVDMPFEGWADCSSPISMRSNRRTWSSSRSERSAPARRPWNETRPRAAGCASRTSSGCG